MLKRAAVTVIRTINFGAPNHNYFAVGLQDSIPAMVPVTAEISEPETTAAKCRIERTVDVVASYEEFVTGLSRDDKFAIRLDQQLSGVACVG